MISFLKPVRNQQVFCGNFTLSSVCVYVKQFFRDKFFFSDKLNMFVCTIKSIATILLRQVFCFDSSGWQNIYLAHAVFFYNPQ